MAAAASYPKLKILKATYGLTEDKKVDAAPKLERMMKENNGVILIEKKQDLNMLFGDPEPKAAKKLLLTYQYGDDGDVLTDEIGESGPSRERDIKYEAEDKPTDKMFGRLIVTVHRAADLKDVASFGGKMDPYYTLTCGSEKFTSKTAEKAHTNPNWEGQHALNLDGSEDVLHLTFTDKRLLGDTHIGRADLPLGTLAAHTDAQWFTISEMANFNKQAGKVLVTASFKGRGGPRAAKKAAAAQPAPAAQPAQVVYVAVPAVPVQQKEAEGPKCVCDKGHAMTWHTEDRCMFTCTGCQKSVSGSVGKHYQCGTCQIYWLCAPCSAAAIANGYSPSAPVTAPICDKNHPCSDYTGRKPVGYHNEYKCDVCAKQHAFGQVVKYWHCDPCQFDCCVPCGDRFIKAGAAPAFKKIKCAKGHNMTPGWNHTPADAKGQTFACAACHKTHRYTPAHNYYHCAHAGCHEAICGDCVTAKPAH